MLKFCLKDWKAEPLVPSLSTSLLLY